MQRRSLGWGIASFSASLAIALPIACGTTSSPAIPDDGGARFGDGSVVESGSDIDAAIAIDATPPTPVCSESAPRMPPAKLIVMPDAGEEPFVTALENAKSSIHVLIYELGKGGIQSELVTQAKAGLDVKVIFDQSEQSYDQAAYDAIQAAGGKVLWSDPQFTYMHAKIIVIDGREAIVSSGNFTLSQMTAERNYAVIDDDPADVAALSSLFDADFARMTPDLSCTRALVSPVSSKPRILSLIKGATKSLWIESMEFADSDVRAAVLDRANAGLDVKVLLADTNFVSTNADALSYLENNAIPGASLAHPTLHVKSIIVDGDRAYLGSENLSYTSLAKNREVGVEIFAANGEDVASMVSTFASDWAKSTKNPTLDAGSASDAGDDAGDGSDVSDAGDGG